MPTSSTSSSASSGPMAGRANSRSRSSSGASRTMDRVVPVLIAFSSRLSLAAQLAQGALAVGRPEELAGLGEGPLDLAQLAHDLDGLGGGALAEGEVARQRVRHLARVVRVDLLGDAGRDLQALLQHGEDP